MAASSVRHPKGIGTNAIIAAPIRSPRGLAASAASLIVLCQYRGWRRHRPLCLRPGHRLAVSGAECSRKPNRPDVYRSRCAGRNGTMGSQTYKAMSAPPAKIFSGAHHGGTVFRGATPPVNLRATPCSSNGELKGEGWRARKPWTSNRRGPRYACLWNVNSNRRIPNAKARHMHPSNQGFIIADNNGSSFRELEDASDSHTLRI